MLLRHFRFQTLLLACLCGFAGGAVAQAPPAPPAPSAAPAPSATPPPPAPLPAAAPMPLTVLVVDVQALLQNSKAAKMVHSQIDEKFSDYKKEISHQEEALRAERDTIQRQQASLSADALNQEGRKFQQKLDDLQRNVQGKREALEKSNGEALSKIQQEMLKIIADIAKERKTNLVLQRSDIVLFDQSFDATDEVLQKLDEQMPTLTVNFVAPTPPPAPTPTDAAAPPAAPAKLKKK